MLKRIFLASVLALYWVIGGAINWETGPVTLICDAAAASTSPSPELTTRFNNISIRAPRKIIRRPAIAVIALPSPLQTSPSVPSSPAHTLIQRPSVSTVPSPSSPAMTSSVNLPGKLIRRPSVGPTSAPIAASTAAIASVYTPQTVSPPMNGVIPSITPSAGTTASANIGSRNTAQAAMATGNVTAPIFAPSLQSALASASMNPTPFGSLGKLLTDPQSGAVSASSPRKLTQRLEVADILAQPASSGTPPPPPPTPLPLGPGTATLTWSPNFEPDLAGYRVYVGLASGAYGSPINVGNVTTYQVMNLALGQTYFFVISAYDTSGLESSFSNEVSKSIF